MLTTEMHSQFATSKLFIALSVSIRYSTSLPLGGLGWALTSQSSAHGQDRC